MINVYTDGSYLYDGSNRCGAGVHITTQDGRVVESFGVPIPPWLPFTYGRYVEIAEMVAAMTGVGWALASGYRSIQLVYDNYLLARPAYTRYGPSAYKRALPGRIEYSQWFWGMEDFTHLRARLAKRKYRDTHDHADRLAAEGAYRSLSCLYNAIEGQNLMVPPCRVTPRSALSVFWDRYIPHILHIVENLKYTHQ